MNVLRAPSFFRPVSRPSSPAPVTPPPSRPDSGIGFERSTRPLNKLSSLGNFRRASPAPSVTGPSTPAPLIQDGSYLEMLSLKMSEAVSKALAQPSGTAATFDQVAGRRPIPQGRGHAFGALIASEILASRDNPNLHRAIIRSLHRPLSVLLNNLSSHLLPIITSPAFQAPPSYPIQLPYWNPTQLHALALASFAGELLETFDDLNLGIDGDTRGDGLKPIREGLTSIANRVITPLLIAMKNELLPLIDSLDKPTGMKSASGVKGTTVHHPSIVALQAVLPICAKALSRYTNVGVCETQLATFLISIVWRALVALSHRRPVPVSMPPSPAPSLALLPVPSKGRRGSPTTTPPMTPPAARFTLKLPPSSRPPSPTLLAAFPAAADARVLYDLLNLLPRPAGNKSSTQLAREAVDDAFNGLNALAPLFETIHQITHGPLNMDEEQVEETCRELELLTTELPLLIALPVLLNGFSSTSDLSVAAILGLTEEEYKKGCLSGFSRAEECAAAVAQPVYDYLESDSETSQIVTRWLELEMADTPAVAR